MGSTPVVTSALRRRAFSGAVVERFALPRPRSSHGSVAPSQRRGLGVGSCLPPSHPRRPRSSCRVTPRPRRSRSGRSDTRPSRIQSDDGRPSAANRQPDRQGGPHLGPPIQAGEREPLVPWQTVCTLPRRPHWARPVVGELAIGIVGEGVVDAAVEVRVAGVPHSGHLSTSSPQRS